MTIEKYSLKIRRFLDEIRYRNAFVDPKQLDSVIELNRKTLNSVSNWINEPSMRNSCFNYGIPPHVVHLINQPINKSPTYTDVMCKLITQLKQPVSYLEIGVSVGKNFLQIASAHSELRMTGFDIEDISPPLADRFTLENHERSWLPPKDSIRKRPCSLNRFSYNNNIIEYLCGDVFDQASWNALAEKKFNFIYSDAFHSPEALLFEWDMIEERGLLNKTSFICMWDDLGGAMLDAFLEVSKHITQYTKPNIPKVSLYRYNGWNGQHEPSHLFGLITLNI